MISFRFCSLELSSSDCFFFDSIAASEKLSLLAVDEILVCTDDDDVDDDATDLDSMVIGDPADNDGSGPTVIPTETILRFEIK